MLTLGRKFFLYTAGTLVLVLLSAFLTLERQQSRQWEDHLRTQSIAFARLATPQLLKMFRGEFPPSRRATLQNVYDFLGFNRELVQFSLYSAGGQLLFESDNLPGFSTLDLALRHGADVHARLSEQRITAVTRTLDNGHRVLDLLAPAFGPTGAQVLAVRYIISYDSVDLQLNEVREQFLRIGLLALGCSLLLTALAARQVTRPIKALTAGARAVAQGRLETRVANPGQDELGKLARAFNDMATSLTASQSELQEKNRALSSANAELQQIQEHLIRTERLAAIGQLAAGVSHEIDNPVGIILGYAELLLDDLAADDPRREDIQAIITECQRCRRITGGLLGFARSTPVHREPIDLAALARETLDSLRPQKMFRGVECRLEVTPGLPNLEGDADRLRQVLVNLLLNAAQALGGRGRITVRLEAAAEGLVLWVADDGPGIPEALRERIFEPFFSTKARGEGTGLGLPVCRKLIEEHGGSLTVATGGDGGALFRVQLPLVLPEKSFDKAPDDSLG